MAIQVTCEECFRDYSLPERFAGKKVKCKGCGAAIRVPEAVGAAGDEFDDIEFASPASVPPGRVRPAAAPVKKPARERGLGFWIAIVAGGVMVAILLCCGGSFLFVRHKIENIPAEAYAGQPDHGDPGSLFPIAQIRVPQFPDLGQATPLEGSEVVTHFVDLGTVAGNDGAAGMKTQFRVYLPPGDHAPRSLGCILVAPAGTNLLTGSSLDAEDDYHDETLPYAEAGMAVVQYSIDGGEDAFEDEEAAVRAPYLQFRAAGAGVVNTRNALEFALAKLPMVDPQKIYAAGHSSAATLALLAAEHEQRLAGAIAYAPATDVEARLKDLTEAGAIANALFPKINEFLKQSSPLTHVAHLKRPVFLFHAKDDSNVPFADSQRFADQLRAKGTEVTFETADTGDHYESMTADGIPRALKWLEARGAVAAQ